MGEAGEKTDCPVSVVLLSVPVWYPAGSGGGGGMFSFYNTKFRSCHNKRPFVFVVFFDKVINAISGHSWNSYGRGWGGGGGGGREGKGNSQITKHIILLTSPCVTHGHSERGLDAVQQKSRQTGL